MILFRIFLISILLVGFCKSSNSSFIGTYTKDQFDDYWYSRGAEISRFALEQARYGEVHGGDGVLIFVTEAMNPYLQVKADHPTGDSVPIIKLNKTLNFYTGIYPYSIMTSIFSPIDVNSHPLPLKITFTAQEWCGQVFMQMNLKDSLYQIQRRSYFESESDKNFTVAKELSEDALWALIRIQPAALPTGNFKLLQGTMYTRLLHRPLVIHNAVASLAEVKKLSLEGVGLVRYKVRIPKENRVFTILFEKEFPYRIQEWTDTHSSNFNSNPLTTHAIRTHTIMTDYWNKNTNNDRTLLNKLGLDDP